MTAPTTNFKLKNYTYNGTFYETIDIGDIFMPYFFGTKLTTDYKYNNGSQQIDIGEIFQPYNNGVKNNPTYYLYKSTNLADMFQSKAVSLPEPTIVFDGTTKTSTLYDSYRYVLLSLNPYTGGEKSLTVTTYGKNINYKLIGGGGGGGGGDVPGFHSNGGSGGSIVEKQSNLNFNGNVKLGSGGGGGLGYEQFSGDNPPPPQEAENGKNGGNSTMKNSDGSDFMTEASGGNGGLCRQTTSLEPNPGIYFFNISFAGGGGSTDYTSGGYGGGPYSITQPPPSANDATSYGGGGGGGGWSGYSQGVVGGYGWSGALLIYWTT